VISVIDRERVLGGGRPFYGDFARAYPNPFGPGRCYEIEVRATDPTGCIRFARFAALGPPRGDVASQRA